VERAVLGVALADSVGDLGPGQFDAEVRGLAAIGLNPELRVQIERVGRAMQAFDVADVDALLVDLDTVVAVLDRRGGLFDLGPALGEGLALVRAGKTAVQLFRRGVLGSGTVHDAPAEIGLAHRRAAVRRAKQSDR
jgi:hypothetical protein